MIKSQLLLKCLGLLIIFLAYSWPASQAQTTILTAPSTDIQSTHKTYLEADFAGHLSSFESGGFQTYGARLLYGVRKGLEVGVNVFLTRAGGVTQSIELQPNAKWQLYENEEKGVAVAVGGVLFLPVLHPQVINRPGLLYATASKKVKATRGPRLTGGAYRMMGLTSGRRSGGILGYEQPVNRKLTLLADWYSGKNRLGYGSAGFGVTISKKSILYVCYSFGNAGRANNGLGSFYGWAF